MLDLQCVQPQVHTLPTKPAWRSVNRSVSQNLIAISLIIAMMRPCAHFFTQVYHIAPLRNAPGITTGCPPPLEYLTSTLR